MRDTFYKSKYWIINHIILAIVTESIVIVSYVISVNIGRLTSSEVLMFVIAFIFILFAFSLVFILAPKAYLSKITLSNETISWNLLKKNICKISWNEIVDVKIEYRLYRKCLVFTLKKNIGGFKKKELYFNVDKRNINLVSNYCYNIKVNEKIVSFIENKDYQTHYVIWKKN
ncbi:MAG: hypothetical protein WC351_02535 [Candidatus Izemoplasmatales bacterium]|jgi:hypothetical protein